MGTWLSWQLVEKLAFGLGCVVTGIHIAKYFQMKDDNDDDHNDE